MSSELRHARPSRPAIVGAVGLLVSAFVAATLVAIPAIGVAGDVGTDTSSGSALVASEGAGRYRDQITWVNWGAHGATLPGSSSTTVTQWQEINDRQRLEVQCTMTRGTSQSVTAYLPGTYAASGLPQLYRSSGSPGLVAGFATPDGATRTVKVACAASLASYTAAGYTTGRTTVTIPLSGLVVADAEALSGGDGFFGPAESIVAKAASGTTWRLIDRYRGTCTSTYKASEEQESLISSDRVLTLTNTSSCPSGGLQPAAVAFADGATTVDLTLKGSGVTAAAIGYMVGVDHGDASATFGGGAAIVQPVWTGGSNIPAPSLLNVRGTDILASGFTLSSPAASTPRLGDRVFPNRRYVPTVGATGDDGWDVPNGSNDSRVRVADEDAFTAPPKLTVHVGASRSYSQTVRCTGGSVRAWVDWNGSGSFLDPTEASTIATCSGGQATVQWAGVTVPSGSLGARVMRVSVAANAEHLDGPNRVILAGEVEDWIVDLTPAFTVSKTASATTMPAGGTVTFSIVVTNRTAGALTAYVADDYSGAFDDATLVAPLPSGLVDEGAGRLTWSGSVPGNSAVTLQYSMTMRSSSGGPGDQVLTNVVAVASAALPTSVTCPDPSVERTAGVCARLDLYRPGLSIDKQAFLATDTAFASPLGEAPELPLGTAVRWRYVVTNTGSTSIPGVTVSAAGS